MSHKISSRNVVPPKCVHKLCDVKPASTPQLIYNSGRSFTDSQNTEYTQKYFTRMKLRRFTLPVVNQLCHDAFYISKELTGVEYN